MESIETVGIPNKGAVVVFDELDDNIFFKIIIDKSVNDEIQENAEGMTVPNQVTLAHTVCMFLAEEENMKYMYDVVWNKEEYQDDIAQKVVESEE
ncbi:MAG: hypothetical protein R8M45_04420 [Ghiorsea sp.]